MLPHAPFFFPLESTLESTTTSWLGRILHLQTGASVSHAHPFKFFVQTSCAKEQYKVICVVFWGCWEQSLRIRTVCQVSTVQILFCRRVQAVSYQFNICLLCLGIGGAIFYKLSPPHPHFADQRKRNLPTDERKRNCFLLFVFFQEGPVNSLLEHYFINIKHQDTSLIFYCFPSRRGKKVGWNQWSANAFFIYPVYHLLAALISTLNLLGSVWNWDGFSKAFFFGLIRYNS